MWRAGRARMDMLNIHGARPAACFLIDFGMVSGAGRTRRSRDGTFPVVKNRLFAQATVLGGRGIRVLYRFYGADDVLLYVGVTADMPNRFNSHSSHSQWWREVVRVHVERIMDYADMFPTEKAVIAAERPLHNKLHNRGWRV